MAGEHSNKEEQRKGVNASLYISKEADRILDDLEEPTRRSRSEIVSIIIERHGPQYIQDPKSL